MVRLLEDFPNKYKVCFGLLRDDLSKVKSTDPATWTAFKKSSFLSDADALEAVSLGKGPWVWVADLGLKAAGAFDPNVPGRIELSRQVLDRYETSSTATGAKEFMLTKILHELCHWGCKKNGQADYDTAGEEFETARYGAELKPWWWSSTATPAAQSYFSNADARAKHLRDLLASGDQAPGQEDDPDHKIFAGKDVGVGMPRGYRNNNPGNIRKGANWVGLAEASDELPDFQAREASFCVFREPEWGLRALIRLLRTYRNTHNLKTPRQIISRWAPASDGNDVDAYSRALANALSVGPDDEISNLDNSIVKMIKAIARHENGDSPPYADIQYDAALLLSR